MTTKIFITGGRNAGEHKGKTVQSIIRREFGSKAVFVISQDRNSPEAGMIGYPASGGGFNILGKVLTIESTDANGGHEEERLPAWV